MNKLLFGLIVLLAIPAWGQIDDSLNTVLLEQFPRFSKASIPDEDIEFDDVKQKGKADVILFKSLYVQKYQGTWMYNNDSSSLKLKANKMAYFPTGTKAVYCGLSYDATVKVRKFFRGVSYRIREELVVGDTLKFTLITLADKDSRFQPHLYTSNKLKARRGRLKNGDYLTYQGMVPKPSVNDKELVVNHIEIPIDKSNEGMAWVHIINNEDAQDKGFIIESDYVLKGAIDDEFQRVYFKLDSYRLSSKAKTLLNEIASGLNSNNSIVLRGYADPSGQKEYNMELARKRAVAVMDYLIKKGVSPSRVKVEEFDIGINKLAKENRICTILVL